MRRGTWNDKKWNLTSFPAQKALDASFRPQANTGRQPFKECSAKCFKEAHLRANHSEDGVASTVTAEPIPIAEALGAYRQSQSRKTKSNTRSIKTRIPHCNMQRPREAFWREKYESFCAKGLILSSIPYKLRLNFSMVVSRTAYVFLSTTAQNYGAMQDIFGTLPSRMSAFFHFPGLWTTRTVVHGIWSVHRQFMSSHKAPQWCCFCVPYLKMKWLRFTFR